MRDVDWSTRAISAPRRHKAAHAGSFDSGQVSWLAGSEVQFNLNAASTFPGCLAEWYPEATPYLQWRDRAGLSPASLFSLFRHPDYSSSVPV